MKRILLCLFIVCIGIGFAGCAGNQTNSAQIGSADTDDLSKVTIRVGQTGWSNFELMLKAAGIADTPYKVDYKVFQGGNLCLEAMASDNLDFTLTSEIPPIFSAQSANQGNFKIIAVSQSTTLNQELVVPKDSGVTSIKELRGQKIAYVNNTTAHYFLLKMLSQAGMKWEDVNPVQLSTSDGLTAFSGGKIAALASYGNAIISAHQQGAVTLLSAKDILSGNFPVEASISALSDTGKRAAIADYLTRINKAYEWTRNNPEKWAQIIADNTHQPYDQALATFKEGMAQSPDKIVAVSQKAIDSQQDIVKQFLEVGVLKTNIDVSSFWSHEYDKELPISDK